MAPSFEVSDIGEHRPDSPAPQESIGGAVEKLPPLPPLPSVPPEFSTQSVRELSPPDPPVPAMTLKRIQTLGLMGRNRSGSKNDDRASLEAHPLSQWVHNICELERCTHDLSIRSLWLSVRGFNSQTLR